MPAGVIYQGTVGQVSGSGPAQGKKSGQNYSERRESLSLGIASTTIFAKKKGLALGDANVNCDDQEKLGKKCLDPET